MQVFESVERHQQSENELQERVRQLSEELSRQKQLLTATEQQYLQQLDTLDTERTQAEVSAAVKRSCFVCTECLPIYSSVYTNILVLVRLCSTVPLKK